MWTMRMSCRGDVNPKLPELQGGGRMWTMQMDCRGKANPKLPEQQGGGRMPTMQMNCREDTGILRSQKAARATGRRQDVDSCE